MSSSALRNTLDHLALDPDSGEDRRYLITMLRRLGYTDREIQYALAGEPAQDDETRVIEVEYTGSGARADGTFQMVGGVEEGKGTFNLAPGQEGVPMQFTMAEGGDGPMQFNLADDAGVETLEGFELEDQDLSEFDDWSDDWGDENPNAEGDETETLDDGDFSVGDGTEVEFIENRLVQFRESHSDLLARADAARDIYGQDDDAVIAGWEEVESTDIWGAQDPSEGQEPWAPEEELQEDAGADSPDTEWAPAEEADGGWAPAPEEEETWEPVADTSWEDVEEDAWEPVEEASEPEVEWGEADGSGFRYGDFTLYSRDVELQNGRRQRIFFFSKTYPTTGEPADLPDGYEVGENENSGLPFLRPIGSGEEATPAPELAPGKRIRVRRIEASSKEEAERLAREEGLDVRGSAGIQIEEKDDE